MKRYPKAPNDPKMHENINKTPLGTKWSRLQIDTITKSNVATIRASKMPRLPNGPKHKNTAAVNK